MSPDARHLALALALVCSAPASMASDTLVADLERRLARSGVEAVNAHLVAHWSSAMLPLHRQTAACQRPAVSLTVRLSRGHPARAAAAHGDALRAAAGRCAGYVLALLTAVEVPRLCTSMASWGPATAARELRRRIADIDADGQLRASPRGQACRAAYHPELHNTPLAVRPTRAPARPASPACRSRFKALTPRRRSAAPAHRRGAPTRSACAPSGAARRAHTAIPPASGAPDRRARASSPAARRPRR